MQDGTGVRPWIVEVPTAPGQLIVSQASSVPAFLQIDSDDAEAEEAPTSPRPVVLPEEPEESEEKGTWKDGRIERTRLLNFGKKHGETASPANAQPEHAPHPAGQVGRQSLASASDFPSNTRAEAGQAAACSGKSHNKMHRASPVGNLAIPGRAAEPDWYEAEVAPQDCYALGSRGCPPLPSWQDETGRVESLPGEGGQENDATRCLGSIRCGFMDGAECRPCCFNIKASGCRRGADCTFCHVHMPAQNPSQQQRKKGKVRQVGEVPLLVVGKRGQKPKEPGRVH